MELVLRVDGSSQIGLGHAVRCLALAQAWRDRGGNVTILSTCLPEVIRRDFLREQVRAIDLPEVDSVTRPMLDALDRADWTIFDSYTVPSHIRDLAREHCSRVGLIDDFAYSSRPVDVDLLIDQNLGATIATYEGDGTTRLALGPRYALLRRFFRRSMQPNRPTNTQGLNILVSLGGSNIPDLAHSFKQTMKTLTDLGHRVTAVGADLGTPKFDFNRLPLCIAESDLAISAAGSTTWELLWAGTPTVTIPIVDNQVPVAAQLTTIGATICLDPALPNFGSNLVETTVALIANPNRRAAMTAIGHSLVDGLGAERVVSAMIGPKSR